MIAIDFRFGQSGRGDYQLLKRMAVQRNFFGKGSPGFKKGEKLSVVKDRQLWRRPIEKATGCWV